MDFVELRIELSNLTEEALQERDLEALQKIKKIAEDPGPEAPENFSEFFYCMVEPEILQKLK